MTALRNAKAKVRDATNNLRKIAATIIQKRWRKQFYATRPRVSVSILAATTHLIVEHSAPVEELMYRNSSQTKFMIVAGNKTYTKDGGTIYSSNNKVFTSYIEVFQRAYMANPQGRTTDALLVYIPVIGWTSLYAAKKKVCEIENAAATVIQKKVRWYFTSPDSPYMQRIFDEKTKEYGMAAKEPPPHKKYTITKEEIEVVKALELDAEQKRAVLQGFTFTKNDNIAVSAEVLVFFKYGVHLAHKLSLLFCYT